MSKVRGIAALVCFTVVLALAFPWIGSVYSRYMLWVTCKTSPDRFAILCKKEFP